MDPAGLEPVIPVSERSHTHAWDRTAIGTGGNPSKTYIPDIVVRILKFSLSHF